VKTLSIRQPWAWLIVNGYKDIENRDWKPWMLPKWRGRFLVHASKGMTHDEYESALYLTDEIEVPEFHELERGGIVGAVDLIGVVKPGEQHLSKWFFGPCGLLLANPGRCTLIPLKGQLGFFDVNLNEISKRTNGVGNVQAS
jgi:hypothetical protein